MKSLNLVWCLMFALQVNAQIYPVPVYTVTSYRTPEPGDEAYKAIDGDINTTYHSQWYVNGIPDTLDFYFTAQAQSIKKIVYIPRQSQLNGVWTNVDVYYSTQNQPDNFLTLASNLNWAADNANKTIDLPNAIQNVAIIKFAVNAGYANFSSCAEMQFFSETPYANSNIDCTIPTTELSANGANDIKVAIQATGSYASSYQSGENISGSFDNDLNTLYHSSYNNTVFPDTLNYHFNGTSPIDYLKYIPRSDGGSNGNFGNITIQYNTILNSTFQIISDYDFEMSGMPVIVHFPSTITPSNIQIIVHNGYNNFASCAEMEFYKSNPVNNNAPPTGIFENSICSALASGITQSQINTISSPFYKSLAQCLFDESYNIKYRVQEFEVFKPTQKITEELKVGGYDPYENATGIVFNSGDTIALFAQDIPLNVLVYLRIKDFASGLYGTESFYPLQNGLNVFKISNSGLGYISYFNQNLTLQKIKLNIVSGKVNGYFDAQTSSANEWPELLDNTNYPKMDIRGEFAHLVFDRNALKSECPFDGLALIQKYDTIIRYERLMMGWFKYNLSPKNHQLAFTESGGGWYAGGLGIHLDLDWGVSNICNPNKLDLWGIPHEFGHVNQIYPDLNWIGTTEVTNNVYSVWVYYKMNKDGNKYTRLEAEVNQPSPDMPAVAGGTINGTIDATYVKGKALQQDVNYDVFKTLVPFWQLELYYQSAGACKNAPELNFEYPGSYSGIDYARWYGTVSELSRNTNSSGLTNGELILNFVKNTCDAVKEDLTTFFTKTGFLKPLDVTIDDYGIGQILISQNQIDQTVAYIQSKNYPQPVSPVINYLSANSVNAFKNLSPLTGVTGVGVTLSGTSLLIQNDQWQNAIAFEVYDIQDTLMHVAIVGSGDISLQTTTIYYPNNALKVYAVGYDGQKILVYPNINSVFTLGTNNTTLVYPNPFTSADYLHFQTPYATEIIIATLQTTSGQSVLSIEGNSLEIEKSINSKLQKIADGLYILNVKRSNGECSFIKLTKVNN